MNENALELLTILKFYVSQIQFYDSTLRYLSNLEICFPIEIRRFNVAHTLRLTVWRTNQCRVSTTNYKPNKHLAVHA